MNTKNNKRAYTTAHSRCIYLKHVSALQMINEDPRQKLVTTLINPPKSLTQRKTKTTQPEKVDTSCRNFTHMFMLESAKTQLR